MLARLTAPTSCHKLYLVTQGACKGKQTPGVKGLFTRKSRVLFRPPSLFKNTILLLPRNSNSYQLLLDSTHKHTHIHSLSLSPSSLTFIHTPHPPNGSESSYRHSLKGRPLPRTNQKTSPESHLEDGSFYPGPGSLMAKAKAQEGDFIDPLIRTNYSLPLRSFPSLRRTRSSLPALAILEQDWVSRSQISVGIAIPRRHWVDRPHWIIVLWRGERRT